MKATAAPLPATRPVKMPRRPLLGDIKDSRPVRSNAELLAIFDSIIVEAYGVALTEVQSPRRAERITNRVVHRLAVAIDRNPALEESILRSIVHRAMHKELNARVRRAGRGRRSEGLRAGMRHLFFVGSMAFAMSYALIAGVF